MRVLSVVGARPQFVKLAPIAAAMAGRVEHVIVHTGQHYDRNMSGAFFSDLDIPEPNVNLGVGSGGHGAQTGAMLVGLETVVQETSPDWVLVYGDTNSTLAGAVAATKLHVPVAHLEAGLRSFNRRMPEEVNRVLTDHAADLLLAPTRVAVGHLQREGLANRTVHVGDVMTDVLLRVRDRVAGDPSPVPGFPAGAYHVATVHRPDNTDEPARLAAILDALARVDGTVLLLAHPRLRDKAERFGLTLHRDGIVVSEPLGYPELVSAVTRSRSVITDSGGLQKEAFLLRVPCTTLRPETEWVETVDLGWNVLVDVERDDLAEIVRRPPPHPTDATPYGTGKTADHVVDVLESRHPG